MGAPLSTWPWENLGTYKYLLYGPLVAKALYSFLYESDQRYSWCLHIIILCALRGLVHQLWCSYSNMLFLTRNRRVLKDGIDFKQIDREWDWDNFLILHAMIGAMAFYMFPSLLDLPYWNWKGCIYALVLHVGVSEPLYYWAHKRLHTDNYLFRNYHSHHHTSKVTQPYTASHATPLEHLLLSAVIGIPLAGACWMGCGSAALIYGYHLIFDFLRAMGHSNVEILPHGVFEAFPILKYLIYTPSYHTLHHSEMGTNFCLFMPLYDKLGHTLNGKSWDLHKEISSARNTTVPDFVFLAHAVDVLSSLHVPFVIRSFSSLPFETRLFLLPMWPWAFLVVLGMWASAKCFLMYFYYLRGHLIQSWIIPRFGFQYFLPFATDGINYHIEQAILRADRLGVKVLSLAALNKNESLNGGGTLFVNKHPNLKVRVVHGNTLTAGVILSEIDKNNVKEVFLTGATSKLGRAIALYLCRYKIRVMMLTLSTERFQAIQKEALPEHQQYLVHVTKYQPAQHCKTWIVGKWLSPREQRWAPAGTHFHQFVVPPIFTFRRDCTYGELAAMRLPEDVEGLGSCEYSMGRGVVHACHAGGLVHMLEGWTHHEVGHIDVDKIDLVWEAASRHGLRPV